MMEKMEKFVYPEKPGLINDPAALSIALGICLHIVAPHLYSYGGAATFWTMVLGNISIFGGGAAIGIRKWAGK